MKKNVVIIDEEAEVELKPLLAPELPIAAQAPGTDFSGIARSIQCYLNNGFNNFRILTLHIEKGKVKTVDYSDPYASFEALVKMELANELSLMHLGNRWADGKTLEK
jgi:hypothetical protein